MNLYRSLKLFFILKFQETIQNEDEEDSSDEYFIDQNINLNEEKINFNNFKYGFALIYESNVFQN